MEVARVSIFLNSRKLNNHRSMISVVGVEAAKQLPVFYQLLSLENDAVSVLCCSNDSASLRKLWPNEISDIKYLTYSDVQGDLNQSFNLVIFHDIENIHLATFVPIIESLKGGGILIFLFSKIQNITEFTLDEILKSIESRFLRRLCISFASCSGCLVLDDKMNILAGDASNIKDMTSKIVADSEELQKLKAESTNDEINNALINLCQTVDQTKLLLKFIDALRKKTFHSTISVSSSKGRGKSAALGLAIAASLALEYSNIYISSSSYDNVKTIFSFLFKGMDALNYKENEDYDLIQAVNPKFNSNLLGVKFFKSGLQTVQFILPGDVKNKFPHADLVVIDEAASIALPLSKCLMESCIVFMASTTKGYGGAGTYLYETMIREICQPSAHKDGGFEKITLNEPIFYSSGDEVEMWINNVFCLDCSITSLSHVSPEPQQCRLLYICPETLFSYESHAEKFLQQLTSLFLSPKRNVSPDFLMKIADDTDYHIFCLLSPFSNTGKVGPEILCAILVHAENQIPNYIVLSGENQPAGLNACFNQWKYMSDDDRLEDFLPKNGIHIIDIVTHPEYKRMGYGSKALQLLQDFYGGKLLSLEDSSFTYSRKNNQDESLSLPPLFLQLTEVKPEKLEYLLVSYFVTPELLEFWKKSGFVQVFISKNVDEEYLCFMLKSVDQGFDHYMQGHWRGFCNYYLSVLMEFTSLSSSTALNLIKSDFNNQLPNEELTKERIEFAFYPDNMKNLVRFCQNNIDFEHIISHISTLAELFFRNLFSGVVLPVIEEAILLSFGLQYKTVEDISKDLGLPCKQIHQLLTQTIRTLTNHLTSIISKSTSASSADTQPLTQTVDEELAFENVILLKEENK